MRLKSLKLFNFRNYSELSLDLSFGINIFIGDNGVGKTNILEAIYVLSLTKSNRYGTINDLNSLISSIQEVFPGYIREVESYYSFTINHLVYDGTIIIIMTVAFIIISFVILKRQLESGRY